MPLEVDIDAFCVWAAKIGCPPESIPTKEALKDVFKSPQRELFCNIMKRVQPRQDVQQVHENILIHQMEKFKDKVVPVSCRSFLPEKMQTFLKMQDLKKRKSEIEEHLKECREEQVKLAANIRSKNIQHINLKSKQETLKARVNLLEFKSSALDNQLAKEEQYKINITMTMPVRPNATNSSAALVAERIQQALRELDKFYNIYDNPTSSSEAKRVAKEELWRKMRTIFVKMPNFLFLDEVIRLKDAQLQYAINLSKSKMVESGCLNNVNNREPLSAFKMKLLQSKADLLGLVLKYLSALQERVSLEQSFTDKYGPFIEQLKEKICLVNADMDIDVDPIISNYVVQYNLRNFSKSQNDFLAHQIEEYKSEIKNNAKLVENHEVLLGSVKQIYSDITTSVNRIQQNKIQLGQIKEKILYSKNMLKEMFDGMQMSDCNATIKSNFKPTKLTLNTYASSMGGESFEMGGSDNIFCSTKLDFDSTVMSLNATTSNDNAANATLMPLSVANAHTNLPPYSLELYTFAEIPFEKFNCMPINGAFHLSANPLIFESHVMSVTMQLLPGSLLTAAGVLQEVRHSIKSMDLLAEHSQDLKLDLTLTMVDSQEYTYMKEMTQQREAVEELLDRINVTNNNTDRTLIKLRKLYEFILENQLRHHVPPQRLFNNQTYREYEAEFTTYYRMATVGASIRP